MTQTGADDASSPIISATYAAAAARRKGIEQSRRHRFDPEHPASDSPTGPIIRYFTHQSAFLGTAHANTQSCLAPKAQLALLLLLRLA